jgi:hypothetical protein
MSTSADSNLDPVTEALVERILKRMYRNRLDQNTEPLSTWTCVALRGLGVARRNPCDVIRQLIKEGKRVTAGYHTTAMRGYRNYYIFWKPAHN